MPQAFVTGASALAIRYKDGVVIAADKALSYGKMHLAHDYCRLQEITPNCALVFSGDEADMKDALNVVLEKVAACRRNDIDPPTAKAIHGTLSLQNYGLRNEGTPYMNSFMVAGPKFLGYIDLFGTNFETNFMATTLGRYYCMPLIRSRYNPNMTKEDARTLIHDCIKVMWYNDCLAEKAYDIWFITEQGIEKAEGVAQDDFAIAAHRDIP